MILVDGASSGFGRGVVKSEGEVDVASPVRVECFSAAIINKSFVQATSSSVKLCSWQGNKSLSLMGY